MYATLNADELLAEVERLDARRLELQAAMRAANPADAEALDAERLAVIGRAREAHQHLRLRLLERQELEKRRRLASKRALQTATPGVAITQS